MDDLYLCPYWGIFSTLGLGIITIIAGYLFLRLFGWLFPSGIHVFERLNEWGEKQHHIVRAVVGLLLGIVVLSAACLFVILMIKLESYITGF